MCVLKDMMNKIKKKFEEFKLKKIQTKLKKIQTKLDSGKRKSPFLKHIIIKRAYKPPLRETIIKSIVVLALNIGFLGTTWRSRLKNKMVVNNAYHKILHPNFIFFPPAFAFSLVMAFIPIILLIYLIVGSNNTVSVEVTKVLTRMFGQYAPILITPTTTWSRFIQSPSGAFSLIFLILISSWVSASGFSKFIFSCSLIYKHDQYGGFWMNRLRGMSIVISIALYFSLFFTLLSGMSIGINKIHWLKNIPWLFNIVNKIFLFILIVITIYFGIGMLFKFSPRFKLKWKHIHAGAIIVSIPSSLFIVFFTWISSFALNYSVVGGNLSYFMTISMSMLVISYFIYIGVIANSSFYNENISKVTQRKLTVSRK